MTAARVRDGPMAGPGFLDDVTAVLVHPAAGDTVVLDNLPCHKAAAVRAAIGGPGADWSTCPRRART